MQPNNHRLTHRRPPPTYPHLPRLTNGWFRFRLRTFLVLISIFAVVLGLFSAWIKSSLLQRDNVNRVRALGGVVIYEEQDAYFQWKRANPNEEPLLSLEWRWPPGVLRLAVGIDFLDSVHAIDMSEAKVTNDESRWVREAFPQADIR
jgi:hypothetical protein